MSQPNRQRLTTGLVLVLLGLGFFLLQRVEGLGDEVVLLLIGAAFLIGYFFQRSYGLLIPGCILIGLGAGGMINEDRLWWADAGWQLGLGAGFLAIYAIDRLYRGRTPWWPLIPGAVLVLVGLARTGPIFKFLLRNWPLLLVAVGVLILIGAFRQRRDEPAAVAAPAPARPAGGSSDEPPTEPPVEPRVE